MATTKHTYNQTLTASGPDIIHTVSASKVLLINFLRVVNTHATLARTVEALVNTTPSGKYAIPADDFVVVGPFSAGATEDFKLDCTNGTDIEVTGIGLEFDA